MVERLRSHVAKGDTVRIFTARCFPLNYVPKSYSSDWKPHDYEEGIAKIAVEAIRDWCSLHLGMLLEITCVKDYHMYMLYDDRCVQVPTNTGKPLADSLNELIKENDTMRLRLKNLTEKIEELWEISKLYKSRQHYRSMQSILEDLRNAKA